MEKSEKKGLFSRIYEWFKNLTVKDLLRVILIVFIIILLIMSAGYLPRIISNISSSLSAALYSVFVPAEKATMVADKKIINSGDDFLVTFNNTDLENNILSISYNCDPNLSLSAIETSGLKNIPCDQPYYLLNDNQTIRIRPTTINQSVVRLVLEGSAENSEKQEMVKIGTVRITIKNSAVNNENEVDTPPTPTTNPDSQNNNQPIVTPTYYGKPDLAIRLLQTGLLINGSNQITPRSQFSYNDTVGLRFEVRNDGDAVTGPWYFTAVLPSFSTPIYTSNVQVSLRPGESIQFTLGFSNLTNQYNSLATINVDPANIVKESNEINNTLTSTIINSGYNNNYYNNNYYNYNNGCYVNGMFSYNCLDTNYYDNDYYYGNGDDVDLAVEILDVGRMSGGRFVADDTINEGDDAAVRFRVTNEGDDNSGRWDYEVSFTPSASGDTYEDSNMPSLSPGQSITIVVEFNNAEDTGTNRFRVEVDPDDDLDDIDRDNNDDTATIRIN